jgi:hypothetical protein
MPASCNKVVTQYTNCIQHRPLEANRSSANQENSWTLCNEKVHCRFQKSTPLNFIQSQINLLIDAVLYASRTMFSDDSSPRLPIEYLHNTDPFYIYSLRLLLSALFATFHDFHDSIIINILFLLGLKLLVADLVFLSAVSCSSYANWSVP